jgi:serine/threonine protein kinase
MSKRGKRLGSRVDRYLELNGAVLTNSRVAGGKPTWAVNVRGCKILSGPNREIVFKVNKNFSSFFAPDDFTHTAWVQALQAVSGAVTDYYDFGRLIGHGAYSEVFLGRDKLRNDLVAIKVLERSEHAKLIDRELKVLRLLNDPSLVPTIDVFDTPTQTYVVMEYLAGGELLEMITDNDHLTERDAKHVLRQVLESVRYLHSKGIVHRDVKPENILCVNRDLPLKVKLTDFGLSRVVSRQPAHHTLGAAYDPAAENLPDIVMQSQCGTGKLKCVLYDFISGHRSCAAWNDR